MTIQSTKFAPTEVENQTVRSCVHGTPVEVGVVVVVVVGVVVVVSVAAVAWEGDVQQ